MMIPLILLASFAAQSPQRLLGADEVLREMKVPLPTAKGADPVKIISAESAELRAKLPGLAPNSAATAWVGLVRDWETRVPVASPYNGQDNGWREVMKSLPGPDSWLPIREGLAKLPTVRTAPIIALMDDLLGNDTAVLKFLAGRKKELAQASAEQPFPLDDRTSAAEIPIAIRTGNLDLIEKIYLANSKNRMGFEFGSPDLVALLGREKAEPIIRSILETSDAGFSNYGQPKTQALAREIAVSDVAHLKSPHWDMISGLNDYAFVAAQVARFGEKSMEQSDEAKLTYGLGLAKAGKVEDALRILSSIQAGWSSQYGYDSFDPAGRESLYALVTGLLQRKWVPAVVPIYVRLGRTLGHSDEIDKQIDGWLAGSNLDTVARQYLLGEKASIAVSAGRIDQAIADYEQGIDLIDASAVNSTMFSTDPRAGLAASLLSLAAATNNPEAIVFVAKAARTMGTSGSKLSFFEGYDRMGRIADAQNAALAAMADTHNVNLSAEGQGRLKDAYPEVGVELSELYYGANQPDQIVTLLHEYPKWGASDLIDLLTQRSGDERYRGKHGNPLGFYAAWAIAETGQKERSIQVLHALISVSLAEGRPWNSEEVSEDPAYDLLNRLEGPAALTFYDGLIRGYPFEARPKMWRGDLLLRMGKPAEAEREVRAAIALDPSDRSAGRGDRHRSYEILGRILDSEGKSAEAAACRKLVEGARLAEQAAQAGVAGLNSKAADLYQQALAADPRDCRVRLDYAYFLNDLGKTAEARTEYEKAAELVLASEGPVGGAGYDEWHAFSASDVIEKAFIGLKQAHPSDPGLLTCLAGLQAEGGDYRGALQNYEKAVAAAPLYVRAWQGIVNLRGKGVLSKKMAEEATLALVRLVPGERSAWTPEEFGDFAALWRAFDQASKSFYPLPSGPLLPLEASKRALAAGGRPAGEGPFPNFREPASPLRAGPGAALANVAELQALFP
ncbi:MAG: tetratricopeptide repeat protein [Fimbriimonadales bacterium]